MPKRFTIGEAERLLPGIDRLLREAASLASERRQSERRLQEIAQRVMMLGGVVVDRRSATELRSRFDRLTGELRATVESIQETGCVVKDLDAGLVDFPSLYRGREVYLCWKLGEPSIAFWHGADEGFAGRKPVDRDFLDHHGE